MWICGVLLWKRATTTRNSIHAWMCAWIAAPNKCGIRAEFRIWYICSYTTEYNKQSCVCHRVIRSISQWCLWIPSLMVVTLRHSIFVIKRKWTGNSPNSKMICKSMHEKNVCLQMISHASRIVCIRFPFIGAYSKRFLPLGFYFFLISERTFWVARWHCHS